MESAAAYGALVERLDRQSRQAPGLYKVKLALLACFGFAVLGVSALLALGLSAGLVIGLALLSPLLLIKFVKVIWIPIAFGWFLLKALWVRFSPPDGYRLRAGEAPELVAEVERLRRETGAPKLEAILIDADLNAAAASVPRVSGLFGHKHYLVLGLPLMQLLSREQMLSVVAHEFGHFGGGHSLFAGWIYRVRTSWYQVLGALSESGSSLSNIYAKFFNWYAPYFNAYSFSLARANEYQADAAAARVMGAPAAGAALIRVHLGSERLQHDFWPQVHVSNQTLATPPMLLYRDMATHLRSSAADDATRLAEHLAAVADLEDTHPTLAQRLAALGIAPAPVEEPEDSSADALLGTLAAELEQRFSAEWRENVSEVWESNHRNHAEGTARLLELEALTERDAVQQCEYARLVDDLRPDEDAVPLYALAVAGHPSDAYSQFRLGALLLARDDASGVDHIRAAMVLDSDAIEAGASILSDYFGSTGDDAGQQAAEGQLRAIFAARQCTARERGCVAKTDVYQPHDLLPEQLESFRQQIAAIGVVKKAWLVRKHVSADAGEPPHFVILVRWRGLVLSENRNLRRVVDGLDMPGSFIVITAPNQRGIARRIRKQAGAPTYPQA